MEVGKRQRQISKNDAKEMKSKSSIKIEQINMVTEAQGAQNINVLMESIDKFYDAQDTLCLESSLFAEILVSDEVSHTCWILDSGASLHVTPHHEWFTRYEETIGSVTLGCYEVKRCETLSYFKKFVSMVETQSSKKLKALHSDNGGQYIAKEFITFCAESGIKREFTAAYTLAQNGVVERMNKTIQERIMLMLSHAHLTQGCWAIVLYTAVYLINRSPHTSLNFKVPQKLWSGHKVTYDKLPTFGCEAYVHVPKELRAKLAPKSCKCILVGYGLDGQFGCRELIYPPQQ